MSDFGGIIRDAREKAGLSPHRVGELIGRAPGTVRAWERGRTVPSDPFAVSSLAAVLAIDELELFRAAGLNPPGRQPSRTIEQELATIAPQRSAPSSSTNAAEPAEARIEERASVATDETFVPVLPFEADAPPTDALSAFFDKSKDFLAELVAPLERARRLRRERDAASAPRQIPVTPAPSAPLTGSYMDDPEERWSYRLRAMWTAAGVGALGVLLLWAGSHAWQAFGETWDALLSGL
jgi:transcriptional regulator with XRE-family HTH domain